MTPSDFGEIRPARHGDAAVLAELESEARAALRDVRGGNALLGEQPAVGDWEGLLSDPDRRVWVAVLDDLVVGYLELEAPTAAGVGVVRQVYVHPEARELGFGDDLLAVAIRTVRELGGVAIESFALPGDRETKNLYERAGVTARKIIVSKRLTD
ncbi:MAG: N-acetyltransferase family protein [Ilumatobacteraceae bacterium]